MKALVTGAHGTVGTALRRSLETTGGTAIPWDRQAVPIDDYALMEDYVRAQQPDVLFHLAIPSRSTGRENEAWWVNYHWTGELAWICRQLKVRFVYTSTVMVYSETLQGPFTTETHADVKQGYGFEKLLAEQRALYQNPDTLVARLGWQISGEVGTNNMYDHLTHLFEEHGYVRASQRWYPACSFVEDTAAALMRLVGQPGGVYLIDSNLRWTQYEIVRALNALHGEPWVIKADPYPVQDQRMIDGRVPITPLNRRLPTLP